MGRDGPRAHTPPERDWLLEAAAIVFSGVSQAAHVLIAGRPVAESNTGAVLRSSGPCAGEIGEERIGVIHDTAWPQPDRYRGVPRHAGCLLQYGITPTE